MTFELIEISHHNDLPKGTEMILYEPPFYGEELEEVATLFKQKFGNEPKTIYRLNHQLFAVVEEK